MRVLKITGIVLAGLVGWVVLLGIGLVFTTGPVTGGMLVITLGILVVIMWMALTGRLAWLFRKV
jgi:hypothetical protein